jgi:manganese transport system substrate-binding protein
MPVFHSSRSREDAAVDRIRAPRKKLARIMSLLAIPLLGTSCAYAGNGASDAKEKPTVLTTFTVLADMAQSVAGDHVTVESITKPGAEIHEYEPTPEDIKKASTADLILENGMNLEAWFEKFTQDSKAPKVTVSDGVQSIDIAEGEGRGAPNPHAWMSPVAGQTYVDNIEKALAELAPEHKDDFRKNAEDYKKKLQGIHGQLTDRLHQVPEEQRTLVTCEGAFSYLAQDAGLKEKYLWGVNSDAEPSAQRVSAISDDVKASRTPAVFCESTVSDKTMQQVVRSSGADYGGTLYVDSLSESGGPVPTYVDLLKYDTETIAKALTGDAAQ